MEDKSLADITVIIPAYNSAGFLFTTLESVATQDLEDIEIIVVDDGSHDETPKILESAASQDQRIVVVSQSNRGVSEARNAGLRAASSATRAVMFLDHDDVLLPGALCSLSLALANNPESPAAHGQAVPIDNSGKRVEGVDRKALGLARRRLPIGSGVIKAVRMGAEDALDTEPTTFEMLTYSSCITTPGQVLFRSSALRDSGGFDPATAPSDDWDLYLRISRLGTMARISDPVLGWRMHDSNASRDQSLMKRSSYAVRRKLTQKSSGLNRSQIATVRRQFAYTAAALIPSGLRRDGKTSFKDDLLPALTLYMRSLITPAAR